MQSSRPSLQAVSAGLLAAIVGSSSSVAVVVKGLTGVGGSPAEVASGLMALSIAMGLCGIVLSLWTRMPVSIAWSTPGAALLANTAPVAGGFPAAVGAFLVAAALVVVAGLWRPLGRLVAAIPAPLANAMLAGVLLGLCLAPVRAVGQMPWQALTIIGVWAVVARWRRLYAVPAAVLVTVVLVALAAPTGLATGQLWPQPVLVMPSLAPAALVGIALPLFIVTMASQNIPGMTVLAVNGYRPDFGLMLRTTGLFSLAAAPFGAHAINLAAITAALCAGEDADPDPKRRYWAGVVAGAAYLVFGLMAGAATAFITASPPVLIEAVAGLALLGALSNALATALAEPQHREAAIITFLVTGSGVTLLGIGGAFWGLVAGGAIMALARWRT